MAQAPLLEAVQPSLPASETVADPISDAAPAHGAPVTAEIPDPLQRLNRPMFKVDQALRTPMARAPRPPKPPRRVRQGLSNILHNMDEPTTVANQTLQLKPVRAFRSAARFVINSTLGVAGLFDVAQRFGLGPSHADFGQTLASYGVGPGAYLYVPIRGPTNVRDVVGAFADSYFWPLHWVSVGWYVQPAVVAARLESTPKSAEDFRYARADRAAPADAYVAARRAYARKRQAEVRPLPAAVPALAGAPGPAIQRRASLQLVSARLPPASPPP